MLLLIVLALFTSCDYDEWLPEPTPNPTPDITDPEEENTAALYYLPAEEAEHEGTWLQWPHNYGYDPNHIQRYEESWIAMAKALHTGENVHIVVYNHAERTRVKNLLTAEGLNMNKVDFYVWKTDDVWVRDNGPIFVRDENDELLVSNWKFNGWGNKADYYYCNQIPKKVSTALDMERIDLDMVLEGGSIEQDGNGTIMAKRSSILNNNRNPGWTQADVEFYFETYFGATNFIWLDGAAGYDITDDHIDGTAKFVNGNTIVTFSPEDSYEGEYEILQNAKNANGELYNIVHLPWTESKVPGVGDYGSYINFYVANEVVLVPNYGDPMDAVANSIIQNLYPNRTIVGIAANELYKDGGMVHCVTQQQPM